MDLPVYLTVSALCRHAGVNRAVIHRLLAQGRLQADALIEEGSARQALFLAENARSVVAQMNRPRNSQIRQKQNHFPTPT